MTVSRSDLKCLAMHVAKTHPIMVSFQHDFKELHTWCYETGVDFDWIGGQAPRRISFLNVEDYTLFKLAWGHVILEMIDASNVDGFHQLMYTICREESTPSNLQYWQPWRYGRE